MSLATVSSQTQLRECRRTIGANAKYSIHPGQGKHVAYAGVQGAQHHFTFTVHHLQQGNQRAKAATVDKIDFAEIDNQGFTIFPDLLAMASLNPAATEASSRRTDGVIMFTSLSRSVSMFIVYSCTLNH